MNNDHNKSSVTLQRPPVMTDRMIIESRSPVYALMTALTCGLTAAVLLFQGAWEWCVGLMVFSISMWVWHGRVVFHSPLLTVDDSTATRYREAEDEAVFLLSDLRIVRGTLTTGIAFCVAALVAMVLLLVGLSVEVANAMLLRLSSVQRLLMVMSGLWFSGTTISIAYLDFPRRKVILGASSARPEVMFFAQRGQRRQLDGLIQALKLEEVMQNVGLGDYGCRKDHVGSPVSKPLEDELRR